jgi:hypothetical protein
MEKLNELVVICKNQNNELEVKDFEAVKKTIAEKIDTKYLPFVATNSDEYKKIKETRAELNALAKGINDNKIAWVNDLTQKVCEQTKSICDLIKSKSAEFDLEAKTYEKLTLNKEVKIKTKFQINIDVEDEKELKKIRRVLDKDKIIYSIKEK